jgi:membrane protein YqaA with SNARE-associated domain
MGAAKWIGGIIGFMSGGPIGALAGYALGAILDNTINSRQNIHMATDKTVIHKVLNTTN